MYPLLLFLLLDRLFIKTHFLHLSNNEHFPTKYIWNIRGAFLLLLLLPPHLLQMLVRSNRGAMARDPQLSSSLDIGLL